MDYTKGWRDRRVLITGLSGFVGSYLGEHLVGEGARVFGLIRRRADGDLPRHIRTHHLHETATLLSGDLLEQTSLVSALDESQPDVIFHLAAQSFVPRSFQYPSETYSANLTGTLNLLEAIRLRQLDATFVFAGTSEEYGLVLGTQQQYDSYRARRGMVVPEPLSIPELPINENNPLRPMSPYGVSKAQADLMTRNYALAWGIRAVVSRAFNHEGAGRGGMFVTSVIARQAAAVAKSGVERGISIGNVNSFRDWSHVKDIVAGYCLLADKGEPAEPYNQGSQRTSSILTFILLALEEIGLRAERIESFRNGKFVDGPLEIDTEPVWDRVFEKTRIDALMLRDGLSFDLEDEGIWVYSGDSKVPIRFEPDRFRPLEVPFLLADTGKIDRLGFEVKHSLTDVVREQVKQYLAEDSMSLA